LAIGRLVGPVEAARPGDVDLALGGLERLAVLVEELLLEDRVE
jgi:hypothetical protein